MITGGEDALYIARRLIVVASEDVGLADNHALPLVCGGESWSLLKAPSDIRRWQHIRHVRR